MCVICYRERESQARLCCFCRAQFPVLFDLGIQVRHVFSSVSDPVLDQILEDAVLSQMAHPEPAETVEPALALSHGLQDRMQSAPQFVGIVQRSSILVDEHKPSWAAPGHVQA